MREGYVTLCRHVLSEGKKSRPRDDLTWELEDVTFTVTNLADTLPIGVGRNLNSQIAALEALQLIGGEPRPEMMIAAAPPMATWVEADGFFYGAYGERVDEQVEYVIHKLHGDRDTRQAVLTLWDPFRDNRMFKRDYPCTIGMGFRIRNDRLNMSVTMRSNDCWLGVAYDVFQFTQLQWTIANFMGIDVGTYSHHAWSLHVYQRNIEAITDMEIKPQAVPPVCPTGLRNPGRAVWLLDNPDKIPDPSKSEKWYRDLLVQVHGKLR
jgi:thymidylate synthase